MSSLTPLSRDIYTSALDSSLETISAPSIWAQIRLKWLLLASAGFLVSVPVFLQAPLVRLFPWLSLVLTVGWLGLSLHLKSRPRTQIWGDLLLGFTWTWLAGSIYWGWLRWEPLWHLPIEAIGLPFAVAGLLQGRNRIGHWFYLGSLLGTAITDIYFYLVNLIPYWRQLMLAEPSLIRSIFQDAVVQVQTPWGVSCAAVLAVFLMLAGCLPLRSQQLHFWTFGGAVLSTIVVDGLFWLAAISA